MRFSHRLPPAPPPHDHGGDVLAFVLALAFAALILCRCDALRAPPDPIPAQQESRP